VGIRPKLFLVFFLCGIVPMLVFVVANYWNGVSAVEDLLRRDVEREARSVANNIEATLRDREAGLIALSRLPSLRAYVGGETRAPSSLSSTQAQSTAQATAPQSAAPSSIIGPDNRTSNALPPNVRAEIDAFLLDNPNDYLALSCLSTNRQPLVYAEPAQGETNNATFRYQTSDFISGSIMPAEQVWTTPQQTPLRSTLSQESFGAIIRYTIPIFIADVSAQAPRGALVVDLKLNALCRNAINNFTGMPTTPRLFLVLDPQGRVICHTNETLLYQPVMNAMPESFKTIADAMLAGREGHQFYEATDGERWLASYRPIKTIGISLNVSGNDTAVVQGLRRKGWLSIILAALAGLATAVLLSLMARRMERSIERVTEGAVAIAGGKLDQRIEVRSSDETRLLAESFNRMTDRLREQIAREAESRQFESFMRLAAMLTHDLKNAITALSLVVSNMEQQFDREEFRAEAMESLKESTDKLRSLVSKLSGPVESLSGEYQRPRPTDLLPHLNRVLAGTALAQSMHHVETHLPESLVATVDAERIERVFENLVLNALEAMGTTSGTLTIEAGPESEDEIFFSVADTGPGISEEFQRTRLFRAFATTKRKGVGLGLYTCREVVRAHGGRIDVKSEKGAGATFRVVLPSGRFTGGE
jgi:signal transduction histidine kinase